MNTHSSSTLNGTIKRIQFFFAVPSKFDVIDPVHFLTRRFYILVRSSTKQYLHCSCTVHCKMSVQSLSNRDAAIWMNLSKPLFYRISYQYLPTFIFFKKIYCVVRPDNNLFKRACLSNLRILLILWWKQFWNVIVNMKIFICLNLYLATTLATALSFTTTTGRQIPTSDLSHLFHGVPQEKWNSLIFELSSDDHLITSSHRISLTSVPFRSRLFTPVDDAPVIIDGKERHNHTFKYLSRSVQGFTISYHLDKTPFSMSYRRSVLHPLHRTLHPGVYVHVPGGDDIENDGDTISSSVQRNSNSEFSSKALIRPCKRGDPELVLEIAVAFETTLCKKFGDFQTTLAFLTDQIYMGMIPFHRQTCIRPKIVYYEGYCDQFSDPYSEMVSRNDTGALMEDLRLLWLTQRKTVNRDMVYLFTDAGNDMYVSRAFVGGVCDEIRNVAWTVILSSNVISHQIGHALNLGHTNSGDIMTPRRDWYGPRFFDDRSLKKMQRFISEKGTCLSRYKGKTPSLFPKDLSQTCQSGFEVKDPVQRNLFKIGTLKFQFKGGAASVDVYYFQWAKEVQVLLFARGENHISKYKRMLAMKKLSKRNVGAWVSFGFDSSPRARTVWSWSEIDRPSFMKTCCWKKLFVHLLIRLCRKNATDECTTNFNVLEVPVKC